MLTNKETENKIATEEEVLFDSVMQNILNNVNRNLEAQDEIPNNASRLLSIKWFLENGEMA